MFGWLDAMPDEGDASVDIEQDQWGATAKVGDGDGDLQQTYFPRLIPPHTVQSPRTHCVGGCIFTFTNVDYHAALKQVEKTGWLFALNHPDLSQAQSFSSMSFHFQIQKKNKKNNPHMNSNFKALQLKKKKF